MHRHPLLAFFALTFAITWGLAALYFFFPDRLEAILGPIDNDNPLVYVATYAPTISTVIVIAITRGQAGLLAFFGRLRHWRVGWGWAAVVLLGLPALMWMGRAIDLVRGVDVPPYAFSSWYLVLPAAFARLVTDSGPMEEFGWRGFALPLLQSRRSALAASCILGTIWGIWHLPAFFISGMNQSALSFPLFVLGSIAVSIVMTAIYNGTGGCIWLMYLFHWLENDPFRFGANNDRQPLTILSITLVAIGVTWLLGPARLGRTQFTDPLPGLTAAPDATRPAHAT